jgi:hypothetical protein
VAVRAMTVLRQYDESDVDSAWAALTGAAGLVIDGTCDELGRLASWVALDRTGPRTLTLAAKLSTLDSPAALAERLPKALIHHNVPGTGVYRLLRALDDGWRRAAAYTPFGPRQRWLRACAAVREAGWPVLDRPPRWRLGELTVDYAALIT